MIRRPLHDGWSVALLAGDDAPEGLIGRALPATVPGCIHTDLLAARQIPDPFLDRNEELVQWVGACDWRYVRTLDPGPELLAHDRIELVCEGLDTIAEIELGGARVDTTFNMHRGYRFDLTGRLVAGDELAVTFRSALRWAEAQRDALGDLPGPYPTPYNFVRKMACSFGWDWGPTLITAGVWRPIRLEGWSVARLASVRPQIRLDGADAEVALHVVVERAADDAPLTLTARLPRPETGGSDGGTLTLAAGEREGTLRFRVPAPRLWWPRGYGEQPLYDLAVTLAGPDGAPLDRRETRLGFRSARLDTAPDEHGAAFTLVVNDRPVFAKGANWIPDDALPTRVTPERVRTRIEQAVAANMNTLRVWGGGLYESDAFYDACDELGVLVWQDFLFACAAYPEEEPHRSEVEAEARYQVERLMAHPSLILWNGNNENQWGYEDWGWKAEIGERGWGAGYYHDLLPSVVAEVDPTRPYWPGSPWSAPGVHPNADGYGPRHVWDAWNEVDYTVYRDYVPRFVSEFGHQAPATWATLRAAVSDAELDHRAPNLLHHQKAFDGHAKLEARLLEHFAEPEDFAGWLTATQLNQARAIELGVTHFRAHRPVCMGTLYWQLNDDWPVVSWSAIDGGGRRKPLWYATRRFYAERLLTLQPRPEGLTLFALNDRDEPWEVAATVERRAFTGEPLAEAALTLRAPPRGNASALVPPEVARAGDARRELLRALGGEHPAWWFYRPDKELAYPEPAFATTLERDGGRWTFTVEAQTLLRDLILHADAIDPGAEVDEQLVTLLPGERFAFEIASAAELDEGELRSRLRCANPLTAVESA